MSETCAPARVPTVGVEAVLAAGGARIVDLRTPAEFAEDHLPGAVNVPLFGDVERAILGTLYRRSPDEAFAEGRRRARARIEELVAEIVALAGWEPTGVDLPARLDAFTEGGLVRLDAEVAADPIDALPENAAVLHCWRGGLRSRSVVAFLRALGFDRAVGLVGGYKEYRRTVAGQLERWEPVDADGREVPRLVLRGLTGVGKTLVLREIEVLRPGWSVDLEALAGHRSSILGMVGLAPCTQKTFESRLAQRLRAGVGPRLVFEGESRKVGDAIIPVRVWEALQSGTNVRLDAPVETRVRVLVDDYLAEDASRAELRAQLPFLEQRLGSVKFDGVLVAMLDDGREEELTEVLLERYYDPLYRHSEKGRTHALEVDSSDPAAAAQRIVEWAEGR